AVTTALAVSGFPGDRFVFEGFLPRQGKERAERVEAIAAETRTVVLFVSPRRVQADLTALQDAIGGDRRVVVARELTKLHEEVWAGTLDEAVRRWRGETKGELTVVVAPAPSVDPVVSDAIAEARDLVESGVSVSEAARRVAESSGVSRRVVYQALIEGR
ncbi:MAG: SAM-dependent methyltransferase, partial [Actinobacteria bacterium]|nr:SAM-dependent methyltransferase [Actinomycetota bacterium]